MTPRDLPPFELERYFAPREFTAKAHLSCSDCEAVDVADLLAHATDDERAAWSALKLGYTHTRGSDALRDELAALYASAAPVDGAGAGAGAGDGDGDGGGDAIEPRVDGNKRAPSLQPGNAARADPFVVLGPSEGIYLAMLALVEAGDKVVVTMPGYQSLYEVARARGAQVEPWTVREQSTGWCFDPDELAKIVSGAKLVVVNFPHNPTGARPTHDEWRAIVEIVERSGAWLFADEMYRLLDDEPLPSAWQSLDRAVTLGGLSKAFSAPGLRLGWLASRSSALLDRVAELKDYTTICGAVPSDALGVLVLRQRERLLRANRARVERGAAAADAAGIFEWHRPSACTALARVKGVTSTSSMADELFRDTGLMVLPSSVFHFGDSHIRLGLGRDDFPRALEVFKAWLAR